jgi:hypothetical protein
MLLLKSKIASKKDSGKKIAMVILNVNIVLHL